MEINSGTATCFLLCVNNTKMILFEKLKSGMRGIFSDTNPYWRRLLKNDQTSVCYGTGNGDGSSGDGRLWKWLEQQYGECLSICLVWHCVMRLLCSAWHMDMVHWVGHGYSTYMVLRTWSYYNIDIYVYMCIYTDKHINITLISYAWNDQRLFNPNDEHGRSSIKTVSIGGGNYRNGMYV